MMRVSPPLFLAAILFATPLFAPLAVGAPTQTKTPPPQATAATDGSAGTRANATRVAAARPARVARSEAAHPGLGGSGNSAAEAMAFCGNMLMPAVHLREISRGFSQGHVGIDLMAPHGSPIHAAAAGTVLYAGWYYAYGNIVDIRHTDGVVTRYAHMSAFAPDLRSGTPVLAGDEIGKVGATGRAHGAHVHFEVRVDGRAIDPKPYLGLASCDGVSPRDEILEAYADERQVPAATRRPPPRNRQLAKPPASKQQAGKQQVGKQQVAKQLPPAQHAPQ
jgi:murein DD-endopeptidase MepM/ murein hydrolase activator NlpD